MDTEATTVFDEFFNSRRFAVALAAALITADSSYTTNSGADSTLKRAIALLIFNKNLVITLA